MKNRFAVGASTVVLGVLLLTGTSQAAAPVITGQPQSATVTTGQQANFIVYDSSSCGLIQLQWRFNGVNIQDGSVYSGTRTGILTVNATAAQAGSYQVVISCADGEGTTISNSANLTVNATATVSTLPPMINNLGFSGCSGSNCTIWWNGTQGAINATKLTLTPMGGTPVDVTGMTQATVSPASSTIYTLSASNSAGTYTQNIFVPVGGYTATISSCGAITAPGHYLVTSSISSSSTTTPCLDVKNTNNVFIDCASGVTITGVGGQGISPSVPSTSGAISFTNVNGFAIRSCKAVMSAQGSGWYLATFANSNLGSVFNSTFGSPTLNGRQELQTYQSNYITFTSDTIYSAAALHDNSAGSSFAGCTITNVNTTKGYTPANIFGFSGVTGIQVINSTLSGGATAPGVGADDGVVTDGINDLYAYNTMKNYWDSAIEFTTQAARLTIYENLLQNAGFAPFNLNRQGALRDSIVSWNNIDMTANFPPAGGAQNHGIYFSSAPNGTTLYFQNNTFDHNFITNGVNSGGSLLVTSSGPGGWVVGGNVFSNNNFNYNNFAGIPAPAFATPYLPNIVTDGGGNVCAHPNPAGYPLVCH